MKKHDVLLNEWRSLRPEYKEFSNDGILIEEEWNIADIKIAFILKEPNDGFYDIRGKSHGPKGNSKVFWRNLRIWRYVILSRMKGSTPCLKEALTEKEKPLSDIAYINIKKKHENRSVSNNADIQRYADRDWELLEKQIKNVSPDVIIFCGTFDFLKDKMNLTKISDRIYKEKDCIAINFFHPSCRKSYASTFKDLDDSLVEYKRNG